MVAKLLSSVRQILLITGLLASQIGKANDCLRNLLRDFSEERLVKSGVQSEVDGFTVDQVVSEARNFNLRKPAQIRGRANASAGTLTRTKQQFQEALDKFNNWLKTANESNFESEFPYIHNELVQAASRHLEASGVSHTIESTGPFTFSRVAMAIGPDGVPPVPELLKINLTPEGQAWLSKFATGLSKRYDTKLEYYPLEIITAKGVFSHAPSEEVSGSRLLTSHNTILNTSPRETSNVHEFTHAKNWFNRRQGKPSPFHGSATVDMKGYHNLPGRGAAYNKYISFDEVEAFARGIKIEIDEALDAVKNGSKDAKKAIDGVRDNITQYSIVTERVGEIAGLMEGAVKSPEFGTRSSFTFKRGIGTFYANVRYSKNGDRVLAKIRISQNDAESSFGPRISPFTIEVPVISSKGVDDPANLKLLQNQVDALQAAVKPHKSTADRLSRFSSNHGDMGLPELIELKVHLKPKQAAPQ